MPGVIPMLGAQLDALATKAEKTAARIINAARSVASAGGAPGGAGSGGGGTSGGNASSNDIGSESSLVDTLSQVPNGPSATSGRY